MRLSIRSKLLIFTTSCCLTTGTVSGQQMQHGLLSQTVSVSTLQIPSKAWKHFEKALNAADHNRTEESQQESTKALEIAPNFARAYILRASQEIHQQQFDAAITDATSAAKIEPGVLWAAVILAGAYNSTHRYRDALLVLESLRGPEADTWQAKYEHSRAEIGLGDAAAALYWSAVTIEATPPPDYADVYLVRGNAFLLAHRWKEARTQMNFYLESKNPQSHRDQVLASLKFVQARIDEVMASEMASR